MNKQNVLDNKITRKECDRVEWQKNEKNELLLGKNRRKREAKIRRDARKMLSLIEKKKIELMIIKMYTCFWLLSVASKRHSRIVVTERPKRYFNTHHCWFQFIL